MSMERAPIGQRAQGKWPAILAGIGVDKAFLTKRHGPCPFCEGKDRFRFDDKDGKGMFFCSQCGAGDGMEFAKRWLKLDFKDAVREVEKHIGDAAPVIRKGRAERVVRDEMNSLWKAGKPLHEVRPTAIWWANRTGEIPLCKDLRALDSVMCPGAGSFAAMIAKIRGHDGAPVNLHRTFLTNQGDKPPIDAPRRVMDMPMPKGSAVRLREVTGERMGVAEGLETAEAAAMLHGLPVWATINAVNLESFVPPDGVREVVVFGDNDLSATGQHVSWGLVRRLRRDGFKAWPEFPPTEGEDWDDVLMRRLGHGVAA